MGMDLYGRNPQNETGEYFRNTCWWWRPLWNYVSESCNDILTSKDIESGHYNDGHFIDEVKSVQISHRLTELLESGEVKKYEKEYDKYLESLPLEDCEYCEGTGTRTWDDGYEDCCVCNTEYTRVQGIPIGKKKSFETSYSFEESNVRGFRDFVKDSSGFEIC